jgi:DsbC/DsbD-like thiol-disulfide interchange protein/cytochrome c biogenesis protein CcdA
VAALSRSARIRPEGPDLEPETAVIRRLLSARSTGPRDSRDSRRPALRGLDPRGRIPRGRIRRERGRRLSAPISGGLIALLVLGLATASARGEDPAPAFEGRVADGHVLVTVPAVPPIAPGAEFEVAVEVRIDRGWHIYASTLSEELGIPTSLGVSDPGPFEGVGALIESKPHSRFDPSLGETLIEHEKEARFARRFSAPAGLAGGTHEIRLSFTTQACDANACLMPDTLSIVVPIAVVGAADSGGADEGAPRGATRKVGEASAADGHVRLTALVPAPAPGGVTVEVAVTAAIDRGWHIYGTRLSEELGIPTSFTAELPDGWALAGAVIESEPHERFDPTMEAMMIEHEKEARFALPVSIPATAAPGEYAVRGSFTVQACDANACLMPDTLSFTFPITVIAGTGEVPVEEKEGLVQEKQVEPDHPVRWRGAGVALEEAGGRFELLLTALIDRGWHIYGADQNPELGTPTRVTVLSPGPFLAAGAVISPEPRPKAVEGDIYLEHEGEVPFRVPLEAPEELANGRYEVRVAVEYMPCDANFCLDTSRLIFDLPVLVGGGAGGTTSTMVDPVAAPTGPVTLTARLDRSQVREGELVTLHFEGSVSEPGRRIPAIERDLVSEQGIWGIILLSISGALIALLTPCVYPMIPITISVFTKQAHQRRSAVVGLAVLFCVGVMGSFTTLGLALSAILGENGANFMATNPVVNFLIGALFIYFAFSLFGYYDVQLPAFLRNRVAGSGSGGGVASVLVMGFVFSVTTFTCVGPIAAALLALAAGQGPGYAAIGMLAFSGAFSLPFFFLALFPKALSGLPRSGGWLGTVKGILGFIELLAAWKFFSATIGRLGWDAVISREVIFAIWGLTLIAMALYILGRIRFPHDSPLQKIGTGRALLVILSITGAGFCFWAVAGGRLNENLESQLLVRSFHGKGDHLEYRILSKDTELSWEGELARLEEEIAAGGERRPIFINFTGHV